MAGGTRRQRDTLKQFHLHFSLRLDRGTRDRTGQERSCSRTVSGFMLPPCNVIKNMSASALDGAAVASGKWQVASCEWRTLGKVSWQESHTMWTHRRPCCVACHHCKAWTVYTPPSPCTHSFILFRPEARTSRRLASSYLFWNDWLFAADGRCNAAYGHWKLLARTAFLVAVSGNPIRLSMETTQIEQGSLNLHAKAAPWSCWLIRCFECNFLFNLLQ